jgi:uncharacterized protein (DUF3084 family)
MPEEVAPTELPETPEAPEADDDSGEFDKDRALAKIAKANSEAKGLRSRVKELEAYEARVREIEDSQKSENEKLTERAAKAQKDADDVRAELVRERVARRFKIDDEDFDLLGTGTEEQITARAERLAAKNAAAQSADSTVPRTDKPVEKLRPGATPSGVDITEPDAYPAHWRPKRQAQTT